MRKSILPQDLEVLNKGLANAHIQVSLTATTVHPVKIKCCYINNPDGTMRWLWPAGSNSAGFLKFYHQGSRKAKLMASIMRLVMMLGCSRLIRSGVCALYADTDVAEMLFAIKDWALFTGTVGENRKLVIWHKTNEGSFFTKLPVTEKARQNIEREKNALCLPIIKGIIKPGLAGIYTQLAQKDILDQHNTKTPRSITDLPINCLMNWCKTDLEYTALTNVKWWHEVQQKMNGDICSSQRFLPAFTARLQQLIDTVDASAIMPLAASHGDFTPWNVHYQENDLCMIDWELYATRKTALTDIFHFIYQDHILIKHSGYATIRSEIDRYLGTREWQSFIHTHKIDVALAEKLYLIDIISYYLDVYSRQPQWHVQVAWLLNIWFEAMGYCLTRAGIANCRQTIIQDMCFKLRNTRYAILKLAQNDLAMLPQDSDIDMCISRKDAATLKQFIKTHWATQGIRSIKLSFTDRIAVVLKDNNLLHLDLIWTIKRKNIVFGSVEEMLLKHLTNQYGVKIPREAQEAKYVWLFNLLNGANTPEKYVHQYKENFMYRTALRITLLQFHLPASIDEMFTNTPELRKNVLTQIKNMKENTSVHYLINTVNYVTDTVKQLLFSRGFIVTFSGVDGAGKSTIISEVGKRIEKEFRMPVKVLRHRPSVLPILSAWKYGKTEAEKKSTERLPGTGNNKGTISSLLRFAYYYTDYLLGQFYVQIRYVQRGYVVLYDRYYFDFVSDSKRSNIILPESISAFFYKFLIKPKYNYFLFAPAAVILLRKQELDEQRIEHLTSSYQSLFKNLQHHDKHHVYNSVCNIDMDITLDTILQNIKKTSICAA